MQEDEFFRDENASLCNSYPPPKQQGQSVDDTKTRKTRLCAHPGSPLCPGQQQVERDGSREISGQMCREMSLPPTMSRCKLQKYFKLNEEATIKSRLLRIPSRKDTFPEGQGGGREGDGDSSKQRSQEQG